MRFILAIAIICGFNIELFSQSFYPVKDNLSWKLINEKGQVWEGDELDAVHAYNELGYMIYQNKESVGLMDLDGNILIEPNGTDIRPISRNFVELGMNGAWSISDIRGKHIYSGTYNAVQALNESFLKINQNGQWACISKSGEFITPPIYDNIDWDSSGYFIVQSNSKIGILGEDGKKIVSADYDEIFYLLDKGFAFRKEGLWGFCDLSGSRRTDVLYSHFKPFTDHFIKLVGKDEGILLLSTENFEVSPIRQVRRAYPYSNGQVVYSKVQGNIGLINKFGEPLLRPIYQEIIDFRDSLYRVKLDNAWGIINTSNHFVFPPVYNYISALKGDACILVKGNKSAIANSSGEILTDFEYDRIEWGKKNQIHCYKGEVMTVLHEENGTLVGEESFNMFLTIKVGKENADRTLSNAYQLEKYEWVFEADHGKWGLRNKENATFKLLPTFDEIRVFDDLGFTIVSTRQQTKFTIAKTSFKFQDILGIVSNKCGSLRESNIVHVFLEDFKDGAKRARCIFTDLSYGLIDRDGTVHALRYRYLGPYNDGMAVAAVSGTLNGVLDNKSDCTLSSVAEFLDGLDARTMMVDYTEYAERFYNEAELICDGCNWGYININGLWTIPSIYDFAKPSNNQTGIVKQQGKWGVVTLKGKSILDFKYDDIDYIDMGDKVFLKVAKKERRFGVLDSLANEVIPFKYEALGALNGSRVAVKKNGLWGFIDDKGNIVIGCAFNEVRDFSEGMAGVRKGNKWGFIDYDGNLVIDFKYNRCGNFKDDRCWVYSNAEAYYINKDGTIAFDRRFTAAKDFENGVARVKQGGVFGLIDSLGNFLLKPKYFNIRPFNEYGLAVAESSGASNARFSLINLKGTVLTSFKMNEIRPFHQGLAAVRVKKYWGFINVQGKLIIPPVYFSVGDFHCGRASVYKDGRCGYIDYSGKLIVEMLYNSCHDFEGDRAVVKVTRLKDGVISLDGEELIKPSIRTLYSFTEGRGLVRDKRYRYYFISENANMYDGYYQSAKKFEGGLAPVMSNGKWGVINLKGMWASHPKYSSINRLKNGFMLAEIDGFMGIADLEGNFIAPMQYLQIEMPKNTIFALQGSNSTEYLSVNGGWIWKEK